MRDHAVDRASIGYGPQDGSPDLNDTVRRRAYLLVPGLLIVVLVRTLAIDGFDEPYWGFVFPMLIVLNAALLVGVWRRWLSLWAFEVVTLVVMVVVLFGYLLTWRMAPGYVLPEAMTLYLVMLWSGLTFPLAYLVLGTRRGLQASIGIYVAFVLLVVAPIAAGIPGGTQLDSAITQVNLAGFFAVLIVVLWVLASRLEELTAARATATRFASEAGTDALTGRANRRQLDDQLNRDIARTRRDGAPLSVLLVDLDHFKAVNDRYGHQAGDRALHELASRLSDTVRTGDLAGRWGGEEFLVIAPNTDHAAAIQLAERCRAAIADAPVTGIGKVTASFGVATLTTHDNARSLVHRADAALYRAKDGGRDAVAGTPDLVA